MKIIVFGAGLYYGNRKHKFTKDMNVVGFIDNNPALWNTYVDGIKVYAPETVLRIECDFILLMSAKAYEMKKQLLDMKISRNKIMDWKEFYARKNLGEYTVYNQGCSKNDYNKKALIISTELNYDGGTMTAMYTAMALSMRGISTSIVAPYGDMKLVKEINGMKIPVIIYPSMPYLLSNEIEVLGDFDFVIVNTLQMIRCACEISQRKPVLWWIHENSDKYDGLYTYVSRYFSEYDNLEAMNQVNAVAVSEKAKKHFNNHYPYKVDNILSFGIPDKRQTIHFAKKKDKEKIIFAIIGVIHIRKAQKIFVEAIKSLNPELQKRTEFLIIGNHCNDLYYDELKDSVTEIPQIHLIGKLTRKEMNEIYQDIDVVVCASMEETMSLTITEGMMYGKVCITTDTTGMADYIVDGENGFICKAGDAETLSEKMRIVTENYNVLNKVRENARKTYEEYFTLEAFGERLETEIQETMNSY